MERRLNAMHPSLDATWDAAAGSWTPTNGWQQAGASTFFHETVIDLSGFAMDSLTFFPAAIGLQDPGVYIFLPQTILPDAPQQSIQVLDIVTSVPLKGLQGILDVADLNRPFNGNTGLGLLGSTHEFETILFGMYRFFTANTNIPFPGYCQLERSQRFDSGEPNASDKLFCYRIVSTFQQDLVEGDTLSIPAARQLIGGAFDDESELVYMQRLKRSYELANQV